MTIWRKLQANWHHNIMDTTIHNWVTTWQNQQNTSAHGEIGLVIRLVGSESSLYDLWAATDPDFLQVDSEHSDQTGQLIRLIWVFVGRTCHFVGFVMLRSLTCGLVHEHRRWLSCPQMYPLLLKHVAHYTLHRKMPSLKHWYRLFHPTEMMIKSTLWILETVKRVPGESSRVNFTNV